MAAHRGVALSHRVPVTVARTQALDLDGVLVIVRTEQPAALLQSGDLFRTLGIGVGEFGLQLAGDVVAAIAADAWAAHGQFARFAVLGEPGDADAGLTGTLQVRQDPEVVAGRAGAGGRRGQPERQDQCRDARGGNCFPSVTHAGSSASQRDVADEDRKSTRLNSSHVKSSYAVYCL